MRGLQAIQAARVAFALMPASFVSVSRVETVNRIGLGDDWFWSNPANWLDQALPVSYPDRRIVVDSMPSQRSKLSADFQ